MVGKKRYAGLVAVLFAALAIVFGAAAVAKAESGAVNAIIDQGIKDVNAQMDYAALAWDEGSPNTNGGNVTCTMTSNATIKEVKDDIVEVLVNALVKNYQTVKTIVCTDTLNGMAPGDNSSLTLSANVSTGDVTLFAKACLGNSYQPGQGILSLAGSSFTVRCDAADGTNTSYTMKFVDNTEKPKPENMTPQQFSEQVTNLAAMEQINGSLKDVAEVVASLPGEDGAVTLNVDVKDGTVPAMDVSTKVVGGVIASAVGSSATKATCEYAATDLTLTAETTSAQIDEWVESCVANLLAGTKPAPVAPTAAGDTEPEASQLNNKTLAVVLTTAKGDTVTYNFVFSAPEPVSTDIAVYRLYNKWSKTHLYTTNTDEVKKCIADGWTPDGKDNGIYWYAPSKEGEGVTTIRRFYNQWTDDHYYCPATDTVQIAQLLSDGWKPDGEESNILSANPESETSSPVFTLFNPFQDYDTHVYTPYQNEFDVLSGWGMEPNTTVIWATSVPEA